MNLLDRNWLYFEASDKDAAAAPPAEPPAEKPPAGDSSAPAPKPDAMDIQAEVDKRAAAIKREAKKEALAELLQELNFEDKSALAALVTQTREAAEAEKSEAQKLQDKLRVAEAEKKTLADTLSAERLQRRKDDLRAKVAAKVRAAGVRSDREDEALLLLNKNGALDALLPDEGDFNADDTEAQKLITAFKDSHKEWFTPDTPGTPSHADATNPAGKEEALQKAREEQRKIVRF